MPITKKEMTPKERAREAAWMAGGNDWGRDDQEELEAEIERAIIAAVEEERKKGNPDHKELTQAEMRFREIKRDLDDLARLIVAEADAKLIWCATCGKYPADTPSRQCAGCESYQEHVTA